MSLAEIARGIGHPEWIKVWLPPELVTETSIAENTESSTKENAETSLAESTETSTAEISQASIADGSGV